MFTFENMITKEEKAVMYATVNGVTKDGKLVAAVELIEDGTKKSINAMLHNAREQRGESARLELERVQRERFEAEMRKDKEAKGKL